MIFTGTEIMPASLRIRSRAGSASSEFTHISPEYTHIPPEYIHRTNTTANEFSVAAAGPPFIISKRNPGLASPAPSSFSFVEHEKPLHASISMPPSPSPSLLSHVTSSHHNGVEELMMARSMDRGTPGEGQSLPRSRTPLEKELGRKRSQYYDDVFAAKDGGLTTQDQVYRESIITVEVKTNVIVRDEFLFLDELSEHLSQRYQRPTSSIFISLEHSTCLLFAGTYESAYIITVTALPSQLLPVTNKRNTALIQSHLTTALGVLPDRGIIRFCAIADEYLGTAGTTYLGQIERLQKKQSEGIKKEMVRAPSVGATREAAGRDAAAPVVRKKPSRKSLQIDPPDTKTTQRKWKSTPGSRMPSPAMKSPPIPSIPWDNNGDAPEKPPTKKSERAPRLGKRKSFFSIFGRS